MFYLICCVSYKKLDLGMGKINNQILHFASHLFIKAFAEIVVKGISESLNFKDFGAPNCHAVRPPSNAPALVLYFANSNLSCEDNALMTTDCKTLLLCRYREELKNSKRIRVLLASRTNDLLSSRQGYS